MGGAESLESIVWNLSDEDLRRLSVSLAQIRFHTEIVQSLIEPLLTDGDPDPEKP